MEEDFEKEYTDEKFDEYVYKVLKASEEREKRGETVWLNHEQVFDAIRKELNLID